MTKSGSSQAGVVPELSVVIVNWNAGQFLRRCVESISNSSGSASLEIIVVDNDSHDDSLDLLKESQSAQSLLANGQLTLIQNSKNVGFGRANNQAFAITKAPFVFLLNPDAELEAQAIKKLLETIKGNPRIGACGPGILNSDGSTQISVYFSPPSAWHTFLWQLKLYRLLPAKTRGELLLGRHWSHDHMRDVPMMIGAALLVRREAIEEVGGFNEDFEMYSEDHEWCWRMRKAGWRVVFDPTPKVIHHGGVSAAKRWSDEDRLRARLRAGYQFERLALSRRKLIANQLANNIVVSTQIIARRMIGRDLGDLRVIKTIHREHLIKALRHERHGEPTSDSAHRGGVSA